MELEQFLNGIPTAKRERKSAIADALKSGKYYLSVVVKNDKKHFKLYYLDAAGKERQRQVKVADDTKSYFADNMDKIILSDAAKAIFADD